MALQPGTRLGPYEVTAQIGVGGMGEVDKARGVLDPGEAGHRFAEDLECARINSRADSKARTSPSSTRAI